MGGKPVGMVVMCTERDIGVLAGVGVWLSYTTV
jgi:hypothetical protein